MIFLLLIFNFPLLCVNERICMSPTQTLLSATSMLVWPSSTMRIDFFFDDKNSICLDRVVECVTCLIGAPWSRQSIISSELFPELSFAMSCIATPHPLVFIFSIFVLFFVFFLFSQVLTRHMLALNMCCFSPLFASTPKMTIRCGGPHTTSHLHKQSHFHTEKTVKQIKSKNTHVTVAVNVI